MSDVAKLAKTDYLKSGAIEAHVKSATENEQLHTSHVSRTEKMHCAAIE